MREDDIVFDLSAVVPSVHRFIGGIIRKLHRVGIQVLYPQIDRPFRHRLRVEGVRDCGAPGVVAGGRVQDAANHEEMRGRLPGMGERYRLAISAVML